MGCDYYVIKILEIEYEENGIKRTEEIEVDIDRRYFLDYYDEDSDAESDINYEEKYQHYLTVNYVPLILFENGKWKSDRIKEKYEMMIINVTNLIKVTKKEKRKLR